MNIVYGGSFNPPTKAHLDIMNILIKTYNPDNLLILPVAKNYIRKDNLAPNDKRIEMLELLKSEVCGNVTILNLEMRSERYLGTYHALNYLKNIYDDLYFVMGADNLVDLPTWIESTKLVREFKFIILGRNRIDLKPQIEKLFKGYEDHFLILPYFNSISSTSIRENLEENKDSLTLSVYNYIKENKLYE